MPTDQIHLLVSDQAWSHLRKRAEFWGYVKNDSYTARGISGYFRMLAHPEQTWHDQRPQYLVDLSERLLDSAEDPLRRSLQLADYGRGERSPTELFDPNLPAPNPNKPPPGTRYALWWDTRDDLPSSATSFRRKHRVFFQKDFPLEYFATLALQWGITDPYHREFQMLPAARAGNVLEAIGRQSLTPAIETPNPNPPTRHNVRRRSKVEYHFQWY